MILKNGTVLTEDFKFVNTDIQIENGIITHIGNIKADVMDLKGDYVVPGLVDIHTHGAAGADHLDGTPDSTAVICEFLAKHGTTSILATVMTQSRDMMVRACKNAAEFKTDKKAAHIRGIYLEGPFFSYDFKGAQYPDYLCEPDISFLDEIQKTTKNAVKIISIAPELKGALDFIKNVKDVKIFMGHTAADYETAKKAINAGACGLTHTFNAMKGLHHREPNIIGAAIESENVICECICDGFHVHPSIIKLLYRAVGSERFAIISDSIQTTGLTDGTYTSGGQTVTVKCGRSFLTNSTIAGSNVTMLDAVRNIVKWNIMPLENAVYAASAVPAKAAGIFDKVGSISVGKSADILILSKDLKLKKVLIDGE